MSQRLFEHFVSVLVFGALVFSVCVLVYVATGHGPRAAPPTCADFSSAPRGSVPARCFGDFHPERP